MTICPCGSTQPFAECCQPVITGTTKPATAEQLMRARYSAYATTSMDFIRDSTHPEHRGDLDEDATRQWAETSTWQGLEIMRTNRGTAEDSIGEVEFIARFSDKNGTPHQHHELGQFKKKEGEWYFTEGAMAKPKPLVVVKIGRNDPCSCGSGIKYKKCCGK